MKTINVSTGMVNYSQRNNKVKPYESCNTTSLTMATSYIKNLWDMFIGGEYYQEYEQFEQPEDRLQQAMLDWGLRPTDHYDLMIGYNKFMGKEIDTFSASVPFSELISDLISGYPWVGSGTFPGYPLPEGKPLGHIVCIVGVEYRDSPYSPSYMIIDDPYGDTMNNWKGGGNDIKIPWDLFVKWMKPVGEPSIFWAHRFKKI